jgi:hypothetical protein
MANYIQLDQFAPPKLSSAFPIHGTTSATPRMDDPESRVPLLSPVEPSTHLEEGILEGQNGYGTSVSKDHPRVSVDHGSDDEGQDDLVQGGVQQADAINLVWSRTALILAYGL